jgi:probable F420-dependent oxidoreductase
MPRPFRFTAPMPLLGLGPSRWRDAVRRIEDFGFHSVSVSEHFTHGWQMEPMAAMMAAASATTRLRVLSLVLANDFRHPVLLHKMAATTDVLSGGRFELGLGAGWMADDYAAAGLPFDPPGVRVARLAESIRIVKGLFGPEPYSYAGRHYQVSGLDGLPKPVQQPHPPILVGGGGKRVLSLAGREAEIVGVHCNLGLGGLTAQAAADLDAARIAQKVAWVRQAAETAGREFASLDLQFTVYFCRITSSTSEALDASSSFARLLEMDPTLMASSPAVLTGTLEQCIDMLHERRERYGFNYLKLSASLDDIAPLVARLSET